MFDAVTMSLYNLNSMSRELDNFGVLIFSREEIRSMQSYRTSYVYPCGRDHYVRLDSKLSELRQNQLAIGLDRVTVRTCHSCGYNCILGGEVKKRCVRLSVLARTKDSGEGEKFCRNGVVRER